MAGTGRIYRRGLICYIAYRWDGREYRESARSSGSRSAIALTSLTPPFRRGWASCDHRGTSVAGAFHRAAVS